jgi:glutamate-1-semialdehyde 2,1-aminomutase
MKGQDLVKRAKRIIPGGGQLLSKRSERFLPGLWPAYYSKAKGCQIWDLDGHEYYDFAQMGVGSCILGYADRDVNSAVMKAVADGSMSTLNCKEEVELAEKLISLHPWSSMARFARTGGEACSIAVRIARAASGRQKVAFCGYHGWHDWYLSSNLSNKSNLDEQLLPGLDTLGVPDNLKNTALPFNYNKISELKEHIDHYPNEIGCIIMEPVRGNHPEPGFLEEVKEISKRIGAVLIFDEVTSGFRMNVGGIHLNYGVNPDVIILGKALGNGYPISAIVGTKEVMDYAQSTFISSTFWTERVGFCAALATIDKMEKKRVPEKLIEYGILINKGWEDSAKKHMLDINISGIPPLTHISFETTNPLAIQTLYAQEMLKKGFLQGSSVYTTYAYSEEIIDKFIKNTDEVFALIESAIKEDKVNEFLESDIIEIGFKRLT